MRPRAAEDVAERRVLQRGADDRVVAPIRRRAVLVVHALAHARVVRDQVDPEDVESLRILIEVVVAEHAIEQKLLHLVVVGRLIARGEPIAEHRDVFLETRGTGLEDLRHAVWHVHSLLLQADQT